MKRIKILFGLLLVAIVISMAPENALSGEKGKASGRITAIQQDGTVMIDAKVYKVDGVGKGYKLGKGNRFLSGKWNFLLVFPLNMKLQRKVA